MRPAVAFAAISTTARPSAIEGIAGLNVGLGKLQLVSQGHRSTLQEALVTLYFHQVPKR